MKRPRQTETIRTVYSTDRQGQPTQKTSMSITKDITPRGVQWNLLKLPVYIILFWLLILGPIFAVHTTFENGKFILAEDFRILYPDSEFQVITSSVITTPTLTYQDNLHYFLNGGSDFSDSSYSRSLKAPIPSDMTHILSDNLKASFIVFWDTSNNWMTTWYGADVGFGTRLGPIDTNIFEIPSNAGYFAIQSFKSSSSGWQNSPITFAELQTFNPRFQKIVFTDTEIAIVSERSYYDIMENARTAEYLNLFGAIEFVLNLPNLLGESKPLAFIGVQNTFSEILETVTETTRMVGNITFDGLRRLNPIGWRP
jgi:hypothetical protein